MKKIILIGSGGHAKSCVDVIEMEKKFKIIGFVDKNSKELLGYKKIGSDDDLKKLLKITKYAHIGIGKIKNDNFREKIFSKLKKIGFKLPIIISPRAYVSKNSKIKEGTIIMHDVLVNAGSEIGKNCIINTKSLIEHDTKISDHCHIATSAIVNGDCKIGKNSFVGSSSIIRQGIVVKKNSFIKAKSLIYKNN